MRDPKLAHILVSNKTGELFYKIKLGHSYAVQGFTACKAAGAD